MPIYDTITTNRLFGVMLSGFSYRKALLHMEPGVGIEPTTYALQVRCSTTELTRQGEAQS